MVLERVYDSCDYISLHRYMGMPAIDELSTYDRRDTGDYLELASRLERNIQDVIAACDYVKVENTVIKRCIFPLMSIMLLTSDRRQMIF